MKAFYEKIIPPESNSFKVHAYEKEEFDAPWHYHPEYELTYIRSSRGIRYTGNTFENFAEDDLVLLGPYLPHCWKNTGKGAAKASAIVIHWDDNLLGTDWVYRREFENIRRLLQRSEKGIKFDVAVAQELKPRLEAFLDFTPFQKLICLLEILQQLAQVQRTTVLCEQGFHDKLKYDDQERINTVYQFVRNHYADKITLADIAWQVHMGEESFSRFFSKMMNKPFFSFLNEYRINVACKLLIESDLPVTQVSYASGFETIPFFYRQFKKYKGCSPKQYRMVYERVQNRN